MPLIPLFLTFFFIFQPELETLAGFFFSEFFILHCDNFFFSSSSNLIDSFSVSSSFYNYNLNYKTELNYNYSFKTQFTQTYLHAAYNEQIRPYRNLLNMERMFGDYNQRSIGIQYKKRHHYHARSQAAKEVFTLLYSHTLDIYGLKGRFSTNPSVLFYFKKQHLYSLTEMA